MHGRQFAGIIGLHLCALLLGCSHEPNREQAELIADVEHLGGRVKFDERRAVTEVALGGTPVSGELLARLSLFAELKTLSLFDCPIGDDDLEQIASLNSLETLYLGRTRITDAGLAHVSRFKSLRTLGLSDTRISDQGLRYLASLNLLRSVNVHNTGVTSTGIGALKAALPQLVIHR